MASMEFDPVLGVRPLRNFSPMLLSGLSAAQGIHRNV